MSVQPSLFDSVDAPGWYELRAEVPGRCGRWTGGEFPSRAAALDYLRQAVAKSWRHYPDDLARMQYTATRLDERPAHAR